VPEGHPTSASSCGACGLRLRLAVIAAGGPFLRNPALRQEDGASWRVKRSIVYFNCLRFSESYPIFMRLRRYRSAERTESTRQHNSL
jgi:hypothetical protein